MIPTLNIFALNPEIHPHTARLACILIRQPPMGVNIMGRSVIPPGDQIMVARYETGSRGKSHDLMSDTAVRQLCDKLAADYDRRGPLHSSTEIPKMIL